MTEPMNQSGTDLTNRIAIVTGAAQGIGARYAQALAKAGASVVCADVVDSRATVAAIKAAGGRALDVRVDVTSPESTRAMAEAAIQTYGRIDILVNLSLIHI